MIARFFPYVNLDSYANKVLLLMGGAVSGKKHVDPTPTDTLCEFGTWKHVIRYQMVTDLNEKNQR